MHPEGTETFENLLAGLRWMLALAVSTQGELHFAKQPAPKEDYTSGGLTATSGNRRDDTTGEASSRVVLGRISAGILWNPTLLIYLVSGIFYNDKPCTYRDFTAPALVRFIL